MKKHKILLLTLFFSGQAFVITSCAGPQSDTAHSTSPRSTKTPSQWTPSELLDRVKIAPTMQRMDFVNAKRNRASFILDVRQKNDHCDLQVRLANEYGIPYFYAPLREETPDGSEGALSKSRLEQISSTLAQAELQADETFVIFCNTGNQSAGVLILYFMQEFNMSFENAHRMVSQNHKVTDELLSEIKEFKGLTAR